MGRKKHWWKKKPESGKDFSLLVPITLDKVSVPFPVSIPLDNISIQTKLGWLKRVLLSALPRSWVDITPASDTDVIIICKASYHQMLNSGGCNSLFTFKSLLTGVYTRLQPAKLHLLQGSTLHTLSTPGCE